MLPHARSPRSCALPLPARCFPVLSLCQFLFSRLSSWPSTSCKYKQDRSYSWNWMLIQWLHIWLYRLPTEQFYPLTLSPFPIYFALICSYTHYSIISAGPFYDKYPDNERRSQSSRSKYRNYSGKRRNCSRNDLCKGKPYRYHTMRSSGRTAQTLH